MKKAITLLPLIFLITTLLTVATISSLFVAGQSKIGLKRISSSKAFYIANAGYEYYVRELYGMTDWSIPPAQPTKMFNGGSFIITTANASTNQITVTSQGVFTSEGITYSRKITATLNKTAGGLGSLLGEYLLYFGGTGTGVNPLTTSVGQNVTVSGDIFTNSNITFSNGDVVNGDVLSTGSIGGATGGITGTQESSVPPASDPPTIDQAPYNNEIAIANAQAAGDMTYNNTTLSGNYYVKGNVTIGGTINITGSAKIVCTGTVNFTNNSVIGNNFTLIAGGAMTFGNKGTVGSNSLYYSSTSITTGNTSFTAGTGTSFISPGSISFANNATISGLIYSGATLTLGNGTNFTGNIIANYVDTIGNNSSLTLNPSVYNIAAIPGLTGGTGGGVGTSEVTTWDETF